jgi:acetyl esterase
MKLHLLKFSVFLIFACVSGTSAIVGQSFKVIVDEAKNGSFTLSPQLPADGTYPHGTIVTVTTKPADGYVLDAGYFSAPGRFGQMFYESMTPTFKVTIDKEKHIGASFIEKSEVANINVTQNVIYAKPGVKTLKYDVYSPMGAKDLPCIIIIHGGGWTSNTEDIMRGLARELSKDGKFVVFSIDYRWAMKLDGDTVSNSMADLVGDVFGAIAHIMEYAKEYGGDPTRIGVTGDSAGGHLSALAATMCNKIGTGGFGKTSGIFEFMPSYVPENKTVEQLRAEMMSSIKAAAPSYGVFGGRILNHFSDNPVADSTWKEAIAPLSNIPKVSERVIPHYLLRGTYDPIIKDEDVKAYVDALVKAGQRAEYVQVGGASHAFLDWKPDAVTKATFARYGVYYAAEMKAFFSSVLSK